MYAISFTDVNQAISWEKQLKGWSRKKKEALFREDWKTLIELSRNSAIKSSFSNPSTGSDHSTELY